MELGGRPFAPRTPADAIARGVGFLPADRKSAGNLPDLSVARNITITALDRVRTAIGTLSFGKERTIYERSRERLRIKATGHAQPIGLLSGGNQQKVLLARALARHGTLLVLNEPTRGVDVGAKAEIHQLVAELAASGGARADGDQRPTRADRA